MEDKTKKRPNPSRIDGKFGVLRKFKNAKDSDSALQEIDKALIQFKKKF